VLGHDIRASIVSAVPIADVVGVVYLLHGANTDETQWTAIGVGAALDDLASAGATRPMALVLSDLPNSYNIAMDSSALINDVLPAAEACLGGPRPRLQRAVGGISRGGELALSVAAAHPELFMAVGGHSPAVADADLQPGLAQNLAAAAVHVWLDVGTEDGLRPATVDLAQSLTDLGATPELHVTPGQHDRAYWSSHLPDYLTWYAQQVAP
jgi:enterochelin esterase-like enzyme